MAVNTATPSQADLIARNPLSRRIAASASNQSRGAISGTEYYSVGGGSNFATTPDDNSLDITGDIGVRVYDLRPFTWTPPVNVAFASKFDTTGNQRSWVFGHLTNGLLRWMWSANGTATLQIDTTVILPNIPGISARVDFDVDNGASGRTATFYTSVDQGSSWQLLEAVTTATATSIFSSTSSAAVGGIIAGAAFSPYSGRMGKVEIRNTAGTIVANPDFNAQPLGTTSFADSTGKTWTMNGSAVIATKNSR